MLYIAICDDEKYFLSQEKEIIINYMEERDCPCQIDSFDSGIDFIDSGSDARYDILFLDVSMAGMDGIELAKRIRQYDDNVYIVFVTAFVDYSLEGYKVNAIRYILKDSESLKKSMYECLDAITERMSNIERKITFEFLEGRKTIRLDDILYVESNLHKLTFHVRGQSAKNYTMYEKLDHMDIKFQNAHFCRTHKSYLVNLKYVQSIERYAVTLVNDEKVCISQPKYKEVREKFICYQGEI